MALALDGSTPATHATGTSSVVNQSLTSVPAGGLLVVVAAHDTSGASTNNTSVITDNLGSLTWSIFSTLSKTTDPGTAQPGHIQVSWARFSAGGSITVTSTGTNTLSNCALHCLVFTGALASGTPLGAVTKASQGSSINITVTTTADGSWVWVGMEDWQGIAVPTPSAGWTTYSSQQSIGGAFTWWLVQKNAVTTTSSTAETLTNTDGSTGRQDNLIGFEVLAAASAGASGPTVGRVSTAFHPGLGTSNARFWQTPRSTVLPTPDPVIGAFSTAAHPGRGPSNARFTQTPQSTANSGVAYSQSLAGSIGPAGALTKLTSKALAGSTTPSGTLTKLAAKALAGASTPSGALTKLTAKALAGTVTSGGALTKLASKALAGSSTPSGALAKLAKKPLAGATTPAGSLARQTGKALAGALTPAGSLAKAVTKAIAGMVSPTGTLTLPGATTKPGSLTLTSGSASSSMSTATASSTNTTATGGQTTTTSGGGP